MNEQFSVVRELLEDGEALVAAGQLKDLLDGMVADDIVGRTRIGNVREELVLQFGSLNNLHKAMRRGEIDHDNFSRRLRQLSFALSGLLERTEQLLESGKIRAAAAMPRSNVAAPPPNKKQLEKLWGRNNLQDLSWLERGLQCAASVCRVVSPAGTGTGFVIPGGFVMTNNHVVPDRLAAEEATFEFNFEEDIKGKLKPVVSFASGDLDGGFATSPEDELDCTIIRVADDQPDRPLQQWGMLKLVTDAPVAIEEGDPVSIIQHPNGGQKKIAVTANEVVGITGEMLQYMTDTMGGSSGAPVFNEKWEVVALHHAGGEIKANETGARFSANEGILLPAIAAAPEFARFFA